MVSKRSDENYIIMQYLGLNLEQVMGKYVGNFLWGLLLILLIKH